MTTQIPSSDRGLVALLNKNYNGMVKYGAQAEVAAPEAEIAPLLAVGTNGHSNGKVKALRS